MTEFPVLIVLLIIVLGFVALRVAQVPAETQVLFFAVVAVLVSVLALWMLARGGR